MFEIRNLLLVIGVAMTLVTSSLAVCEYGKECSTASDCCPPEGCTCLVVCSSRKVWGKHICTAPKKEDLNKVLEKLVNAAKDAHEAKTAKDAKDDKTSKDAKDAQVAKDVKVAKDAVNKLIGGGLLGGIFGKLKFKWN